jgi:hypothetical protein
MAVFVLSAVGQQTIAQSNSFSFPSNEESMAIVYSSIACTAAMKAEEMDEKHAQNAHAKAAGSNQIQTGPSGRPSTRRSVRHCTAVCMSA